MWHSLVKIVNMHNQKMHTLGILKLLTSLRTYFAQAKVLWYTRIDSVHFVYKSHLLYLPWRSIHGRKSVNIWLHFVPAAVSSGVLQGTLARILNLLSWTKLLMWAMPRKQTSSGFWWVFFVAPTKSKIICLVRLSFFGLDIFQRGSWRSSSKIAAILNLVWRALLCQIFCLQYNFTDCSEICNFHSIKSEVWQYLNDVPLRLHTPTVWWSFWGYALTYLM